MRKLIFAMLLAFSVGSAYVACGGGGNTNNTTNNTTNTTNNTNSTNDAGGGE